MNNSKRKTGIRRKRIAPKRDVGQLYASGDVVLVVKDGAIVTVLRRDWL